MKLKQFTQICGFALLATALPSSAEEPSIVDVFGRQKLVNTRASTIQCATACNPDCLFTFWRQDLAQDQSATRIFGSLGSVSLSEPTTNWEANPFFVTAPHLGAITQDKDPALYVEEGRLQLFWGVENDGSSEKTEIRRNQASFDSSSIASISDLVWEDPSLQGSVLSNEASLLFERESWKTILNAFQNTWPLVEGCFTFENFFGNSSFNFKESHKLYKFLKKKVCSLSNRRFDLFKSHILHVDLPIEESLKKNIKESSSFQELINRQGLSTRVNQDTLEQAITKIYQILDLYISVKTRLSLLNENAYELFTKGWLNRATPIKINLQSGGERLLVPLYSDSLEFSFVIYSDDHGKTWKRAENPILGRGNLQPSIAQLGDGTLKAYMRNGYGIANRNRALVSYSYDEGKTWQTALPDEEIHNFDSSLSFLKLASGELVLAYNSDDTRRLLDLALFNSDGTLKQKKRLKTGVQGSHNDEKFEFPSVTQSSNGALHISCRHIFLDEDAICMNVEDGGKSCQNIGVISIDPNAFFDALSH